MAGHNLLVWALCSSRSVRLKYAFAISYEDLKIGKLAEPDIPWAWDGGTSKRMSTRCFGGGPYQQMAVLGMVVMILGRQPLMKPLHPNSFLMMAAA